MVLTNDDGLCQRIKQLRSHGVTRDPTIMKEPSEGPWYYEQIALGYNYRMTDIQSALGISQLNRIEEFLGRRQHLAESYAQVLAELPLTLPWQNPDCVSAWHLYVVRLQITGNSPSRERVFQAMRHAGIGVNVHYIPVHTQPYYRGLGFKPGDFPEAERYYREAMTLPLYPGLNGSDIDKIATALKRCLL